MNKTQMENEFSTLFFPSYFFFNENKFLKVTFIKR